MIKRILYVLIVIATMPVTLITFLVAGLFGMAFFLIANTFWFIKTGEDAMGEEWMDPDWLFFNIGCCIPYHLNKILK